MNMLGYFLGYRITVEPVLFLYMFSVFMNFPAVQDLIYIKVCVQEYSDSVCNDLYNVSNQIALDKVQTDSSHWLLGSTLMLAVPSIMTAQFLGSWSDTYGRKLPLLLPPFGGIMASTVYILLSIYLKQSHVSYILLASFLSGLCGGFTSCILTCMSYISQLTGNKNRTWRISLLESMTFLGGTFGPLCCGWIQAIAGRAVVFSIVLTCYLIIIVYIFIFIRDLPPRHSPQQPWYQTAFGCRHISESLTTLIRRREDNRRSYLLRLLIAGAVIMFISSGEMYVMFLYLKDEPIKMDLMHFTWFNSLKYFVATLAIFMLKWLTNKLPDSVLLLTGLGFKIAMLLYMSWVLSVPAAFVGAVVGFASSWCMPIIRSAMSKLVELQEQGKMFACIALVENACTLVASGVFNSIYPALRHVKHGFVFTMSAFFLLIPVIIAMSLHSTLKKLATDYHMDVEPETDPNAQTGEPSGTVPSANPTSSPSIKHVSNVPSPSLNKSPKRTRNNSVSTSSSSLSLEADNSAV